MSSKHPSKKVCSDLEYRVEVDADERMKRKNATKRDSTAAKRAKKAKKDGKSPSSSSDAAKKRGGPKKGASKQSIKRVREQRRKQQAKDARRAEEEEARKQARKNDHALEDHAGNIIAAAPEVGESGDAAAPEDFFWEVEAVIGRRIRRGRVEYLIRWKGCSEEDNTWEPAANLCDTAMEEATKFTKAQKQKEKQREEDEKKLFGVPDEAADDKNDGGKLKAEDISTDKVIVGDAPNARKATGNPDDDMAVDADSLPVDDHLWKWSDVDQVLFREVERVDVNDPNSAKVVTEARVNGTPLVLVGHVGWANFAKRWLTEKKAESGGASSKPVSILEGQEENQISRDDGTKVKVESEPDAAVAESSNTDATAKETMNGDTAQKDTGSESGDNLLDLSKQNYELNVKEMIKDIGEEDVPVIKRHYNEEKPIHGKIAAEKFLTNCWPNPEAEAAPEEQDKAAKQKASPNLYLHQWQFPLSDTAGRKLCHQNNPLPKGIMGEDLLKFWLDLPQCKLDSPLQYIFMGREDTLSKLHKDAGGLEISIAPIVGQKECVLVHRADGSNCVYHLNASLEDIDLHRYPLLSQARAWRTTIQPGEILLMPYGTYHQCRNVTPCLSYSRFHLDTVNLLPFVQSLIDGDAPEIDHEEVLWNLTTELIKRVDGVFDEVQSRVKAGLDEGDVISEDVVATVNTLRTLKHFVRELARREEIRQTVKVSGQDVGEHNFGMLVEDVEMCLHEFRYRQSKVVPPFKARKGRALKNTLSGASGGRKDVIRRDMSKYQSVVAFNTSLENNYMSLVNADVDKHFPNAAKDKVGESLIGELVPGDLISVKLEQKCVKAEVVEILPQMKTAYLSFEDYPSVYDEYQPYELLRLPSGAEIAPGDIKPGLVVIDLSNSNEYRAKILSLTDGPMARVKLIVSQHEMTRLVSPAMILGRYVPKKTKKRTKQIYAEADAEPEEAATTARPTTAGQYVEVGRRGAARVTAVHGDPATHVDVSFILGASSERMVPIDQLRLAPELDPDSGRGSRQASKTGRLLDKSEANARAVSSLPSSLGSSGFQ